MPMSGLMANLHQFHILSNGTAVHKTLQSTQQNGKQWFVSRWRKCD